MKRLFLFSFSLLLICISIQAQYQYQTTLWFETANGTRDSVVVGNHPDATQGVDSQLGEVAIDKESAGFVWASKFVYTDNRDTTIFLKKQLVAKNTEFGSSWKRCPIAISYKWDSLPLSIYWDEDFFKNDSVKCTMLSSIPLNYLDDYPFEELYHRITLWARINLLPNGMTLQKDSALRYDYSDEWWKRFGYLWDFDSSSLDSTKNVIYVTFGSIWDDTGFAAMKEIEESADMNIFFNGKTISIMNEDDAEMRNVCIYSADGRVVMQQIGINSNETTINIARLPNGVYLVVADTKLGTRKQKIVL